MSIRGLAIVCVILPLADPARAADPNAGEAIAVEHCAQCHYIPGDDDNQSGEVLRAPALDLMANEPATYTEERIRSSLQKPHWPMGGIILSPTDIDNILAYFGTLRHS
ncbi:MAG: hypothetical protein U1E45_24355 [Geminicoccaceae bacterium]